MLIATANTIRVWKFNPYHDPGSGEFASGGGGKGLPVRSGVSSEPFDAAAIASHAGVYFTSPNGETISEKGSFSGRYGGPQHETLMKDKFVGYSKKTPTESDVCEVTGQKGLLTIRNFSGVTDVPFEGWGVPSGTRREGEVLVTIGKDHIGVHRDRILSILDLAPQTSLTVVNKKGIQVKSFFFRSKWGETALGSHARRIETYLKAH